MADGYNRSLGFFIILMIATISIIILYIFNRKNRLKSIAIMNEKKNNININNESIDKYTNIVFINVNALMDLNNNLFNNDFLGTSFVDLKENLKKIEIGNNNNKINYQDAQIEIDKLQDYNFTIVFVSLVSVVFTIVSTIGKFI
tara:strand:- start:380 stop:811 length:432 start_codon:yes stop_codon:yes gene_type:complete